LIYVYPAMRNGQNRWQGDGTTGLAGGKTYTVEAGDTLSTIAKEQLGDANAYPEIFNANRDQH
jgi:nucleoid-associated protein YgaU